MEIESRVPLIREKQPIRRGCTSRARHDNKVDASKAPLPKSSTTLWHWSKCTSTNQPLRISACRIYPEKAAPSTRAPAALPALEPRFGRTFLLSRTLCFRFNLSRYMWIVWLFRFRFNERKMLNNILFLVFLVASCTAHDSHDQAPIAGPHKGLWYNTLPGDGGTQVNGDPISTYRPILTLIG